MQTETTASKLLYEDRTSIVLGQGSFIRGLQLTIRQTTHRGGRVPGVVPGFLDPPPYGHVYGTIHTHFPKIFFAKFWASIVCVVSIGLGLTSLGTSGFFGHPLAVLQMAKINTVVQILNDLFSQFIDLVSLTVSLHRDACICVAYKFGNVGLLYTLLLQVIDECVPE
jgi:hypothetical protein